jgi:hypothetical protein
MAVSGISGIIDGNGGGGVMGSGLGSLSRARFGIDLSVFAPANLGITNGNTPVNGTREPLRMGTPARSTMQRSSAPNVPSSPLGAVGETSDIMLPPLAINQAIFTSSTGHGNNNGGFTMASSAMLFAPSARGSVSKLTMFQRQYDIRHTLPFKYYFIYSFPANDPIVMMIMVMVIGIQNQVDLAMGLVQPVRQQLLL